MEKKSITYLIGDLGFTGGVIVFYNFMNELVKRGYEVFVVTPESRFKWTLYSMNEIIENNKKKSLVGKFKNTLKSISIKRKLFPINKNHDYLDIIKYNTNGYKKNYITTDFTIATHPFENFANYFIEEDTIKFLHIQHFEELHFNSDFHKKIIRASFFLPGIYKVTNCSWLMSKFIDNYGIKTELLNPAIDESIFRPYENKNHSHKLKILTYSDNRDFKAFDETAEVMNKVIEKIGPLNVEWILFGGYDPKDNQLLKKYNSSINYVGKVFSSDLAKLYSSVDIVFMFSWYESFPLPPLEAMKCKTAVVTSKYGTEDYAFNDQTAKVILPHEINNAVDAILDLAENKDKRTEIALKGYEFSCNFTWKNQTDKFEKILDKAYEAQKRFVQCDLNKVDI